MRDVTAVEPIAPNGGTAAFAVVRVSVALTDGSGFPPIDNTSPISSLRKRVTPQKAGERVATPTIALPEKTPGTAQKIVGRLPIWVYIVMPHHGTSK
jgi:hypothetical protein